MPRSSVTPEGGDDFDIPEFLWRKHGDKPVPMPPSPSKIESKLEAEPITTAPVATRSAPSYCGWQVEQLEGMFDDGVIEVNDFYEWMMTVAVGALTLRHIVTIIKPRLEELEKIKHKGWAETIIIQYKAAIEAAESILTNKRRTRKPKKTKKASIEKLIKNIKYTEVEPTTKIASIPPAAIIGKSVLWAFDVKTRMLKVYRTKDVKTFTFKSTVIENCDPTLCLQKKVRKPEVILPKVLSEGKATVLGLFRGIKAVESQIPTMRTNPNFVFLRVF